MNSMASGEDFPQFDSSLADAFQRTVVCRIMLLGRIVACLNKGGVNAQPRTQSYRMSAPRKGKGLCRRRRRRAGGGKWGVVGGKGVVLNIERLVLEKIPNRSTWICEDT